MKTVQMSMLEYVKESTEDQLDVSKKLFERKMALLDNSRVKPWIEDIQSAIPDETMWYITVDEKFDEESKALVMILRVSITVDTEEQAEEVRGSIQLVLHQVAMREINSITGSVFYVFKKDIEYEDPSPLFKQFRIKSGSMRATINHASLAPKCEVVEKSELVTRFVVKCDDDES